MQILYYFKFYVNACDELSKAEFYEKNATRGRECGSVSKMHVPQA